jgi:hypothetical protein
MRSEFRTWCLRRAPRIATRRPCTQADHDEIQAILTDVEALEGAATLNKTEEELESIAKLIDRQSTLQ